MADRYISREWLLKELGKYKDITPWFGARTANTTAAPRRREACAICIPSLAPMSKDIKAMRYV